MERRSARRRRTGVIGQRRLACRHGQHREGCTAHGFGAVALLEELTRGLKNSISGSWIKVNNGLALIRPAQSSGRARSSVASPAGPRVAEAMEEERSAPTRDSSMHRARELQKHLDRMASYKVQYTKSGAFCDSSLIRRLGPVWIEGYQREIIRIPKWMKGR